jgi:hypothetical protein
MGSRAMRLQVAGMNVGRFKNAAQTSNSGSGPLAADGAKRRVISGSRLMHRACMAGARCVQNGRERLEVCTRLVRRNVGALSRNPLYPDGLTRQPPATSRLLPLNRRTLSTHCIVDTQVHRLKIE